MKHYEDVVLDRNGNAIRDATVTVTDYPSGTTSTVYGSDALGSNVNPLTTDLDGRFDFYAKDGQYNLTISKTGITTETDGPVLIQDTAGWAAMGGYGITGSGDQTAALNAALVSMAANGPRVLRLTDDITVNSLVTLQSGVSIDLAGWSITWAGSTTPMFSSATTGVLSNVKISGGVIDSASASKTFYLLSPYNLKMKDLIVDGSSATSFAHDIGVNSSGGTNEEGNRNAAYLFYDNVVHIGTFGTGWRGTGTSASPCVAIVDFKNMIFTDIRVRGWDFAKFVDSWTWSGVCRASLTANNAVGAELNTDTPLSNMGVYAGRIAGRLMIDTFSVFTGRIGLKLNNCKQITGGEYYNLPAAEGGQFSIAAEATAYDIGYAHSDDATIRRMADATTSRLVAANYSLPYILARSAAAVNAPANTSENTLATITIPANALGANGGFRLMCNFAYTSNANLKTFRVRYSGVSGTIYAAKQENTATGLKYFVDVFNRNSASSQFGTAHYADSGGSIELAPVTSAVDTTAATTIVITAEKATSGDAATLENYVVELIP